MGSLALFDVTGWFGWLVRVSWAALAVGYWVSYARTRRTTGDR
ncbi:hypothetical protein [Amycolatopsis sp. H20-H5]|nr:hypothetical protein [Amycolatopsis sp. H20-H5]MEC3982837.1 hypothetical protein [Amycolatopsis sp. H20-H5]